MQKRPIPLWETLTIIAIVLLAAVLRTIWPGITEFKADEARLMTLAIEMAEFKTFPIRGISSSVGIPNFPASVWTYAFPLFFWKHVYSATIFTGLLNTAAVLLCYFFTRRYVGRTAAIIATLMFAVSPWAIVHSRKIWAQNLLPFFVMVWAFSAALTFIEDRKKWLIVHIAVGVFAFQIHLAAISLLAGSAVLFVVFWRKMPWRTFFAGCAVALLTLAPFLFYIFARSNGLSVLSSGGGRGITFSWEPILHAVRLTTGWQFHAITGAGFQTFLGQLPPTSWIFWVWGLLALAGIGFTIYDFRLTIGSQANRQPGTSEYLKLHTSYLLLIWLVIPIATFLFFPVQPELHYLLPIYPVGYILAGLAVERLSNQNLQWGLVGLVGFTAAVFTYANLSMIQFLDNNDTAGGFGDPVYMQLEVISEIDFRMRDPIIKEVVIMSDGTDPLIDSDAAIYDFHLRDYPRRFIDGDHTAIFPAETSVVVVTNSELAATEVYKEMSGLSVWTGQSRAGLGPLIYGYGGGIQPQTMTPFEPEPLLGNFVGLLGYERSDSTNQSRLYWRTGEAFQPNYHLTNQLFDADGNKIGQADIAAFPPDQWRPGDLVISLFEPEIAPDAEPAQMLFGMYIYPSGEVVPVLDAAANPAGDFVEIELK